jgi:hypothetical protein
VRADEKLTAFLELEARNAYVLSLADCKMNLETAAAASSTEDSN